MTPEQFIPFWNALTTKDRKLIEDNLQTAANPGSGFFSSKRFMRGGIVFLLSGNLRIFLSSDEERDHRHVHGSGRELPRPPGRRIPQP